MPSIRSLLAASLCLGAAVARDVPSNIRDFYDGIVEQGKCNKTLSGGFYSADNDGGKTGYCGDHLKDYNVVYLQGPNGKLANMDIDCDGVQGSKADDGRCGSSNDTQSQTSFMDTLQDYGTGQKDLDANIHPYVVFGNAGKRSDYKTFNPQAYGIKPLSIVAVVCGDKLIYGIWGDENGDDNEDPMVGEGSIALATACYGKKMNGNNGHDEDDVLYIAFPGKDAVPGEDAAWNATSYEKFAESIEDLGNTLIKRINSTSKDSKDKDDDDSAAGGLGDGRLHVMAQFLLALPVALALMV